MDMLNSDKCRQAIMKQQTNHSRQTEKVKKAIKAFKKSDDYCDGPKNKEYILLLIFDYYNDHFITGQLLRRRSFTGICHGRCVLHRGSHG